VCDLINNRVAELNAPGEAEPAHVRFFRASSPWSVAAHGDLLAVGAYRGPITLLQYPTGVFVNSFGEKGTGPGLIGTMCTGIRFMSDGACIFAAEETNR
jgi:hypothetical protein